MFFCSRKHRRSKRNLKNQRRRRIWCTWLSPRIIETTHIRDFHTAEICCSVAPSRHYLGCQVFRRLTKEYVPVAEALAEWTGAPSVSKGWLKLGSDQLVAYVLPTQEGHSGLLWLGIAGTIVVVRISQRGAYNFEPFLGAK